MAGSKRAGMLILLGQDRIPSGLLGYFEQFVFPGVNGDIRSKKAFIFSLKNLRGIPPFKMDLKSNKLDNAAKQDGAFGPIFGEYDIKIDSLPTAFAKSSTSLDNSYQFPSNLLLTSDERDTLLAGSKYFLVDDLEAFYYGGEARCFILCKATNTT